MRYMGTRFWLERQHVSGGIMRFRFLALIACTLLISGMALAAEDAPLLATSPTMSKTEIVFAYGGYLWSVPRAGGEARQLTTGGGESNPIFFSPRERGGLTL